MKRLLVWLVLCLTIPGALNAFGIVNRTATRDTLSIPFQVLDSLAKPVDLAGGDSVYVTVFSPGGTVVFKDSMAYDDASLKSYDWEDFNGGKHYAYTEQVSVLDGSSTSDGVFTYILVVDDNTGADLITPFHGYFQIINSNFESGLDSAGLAAERSGKALDSLHLIIDSLLAALDTLQNTPMGLTDVNLVCNGGFEWSATSARRWSKQSGTGSGSIDTVTNSAGAGRYLFTIPSGTDDTITYIQPLYVDSGYFALSAGFCTGALANLWVGVVDSITSDTLGLIYFNSGAGPNFYRIRETAVRIESGYSRLCNVFIRFTSNVSNTQVDEVKLVRIAPLYQFAEDTLAGGEQLAIMPDDWTGPDSVAYQGEAAGVDSAFMQRMANRQSDSAQMIEDTLSDGEKVAVMPDDWMAQDSAGFQGAASGLTKEQVAKAVADTLRDDTIPVNSVKISDDAVAASSLEAAFDGQGTSVMSLRGLELIATQPGDTAFKIRGIGRAPGMFVQGGDTATGAEFIGGDKVEVVDIGTRGMGIYISAPQGMGAMIKGRYDGLFCLATEPGGDGIVGHGGSWTGVSGCGLRLTGGRPFWGTLYGDLYGSVDTVLSLPDSKFSGGCGGSGSNNWNVVVVDTTGGQIRGAVSGARLTVRTLAQALEGFLWTGSSGATAFTVDLDTFTVDVTKAGTFLEDGPQDTIVVAQTDQVDTVWVTYTSAVIPPAQSPELTTVFCYYYRGGEPYRGAYLLVRNENVATDTTQGVIFGPVREGMRTDSTGLAYVTVPKSYIFHDSLTSLYDISLTVAGRVVADWPDVYLPDQDSLRLEVTK